jgi:FkbM family methyltransferase
MDSRKLSRAFRVIRKVPLLGRASRWLIRQYPEGSVVTIRTGVARGLLWTRYHRYDPGVWIGTYEPPIQQFLQRNIRQGDVFYDVGANAGFFTVLAARLVGREGKVVAFEPHPVNAKSITDQIQVNGFNNIVLINKAVSSEPGIVTFCAGKNLSMGYVGAPLPGEAVREVEATTLDEVLQDNLPPTIVKVDIEGGGVELVKGARTVAEKHRPIWILEVHNQEEETAFKNLLLPLGYRFESLSSEPITADQSLPNHVIALCD